MPPLSLLIKPASSACQLQCTYCFYHDTAKHRETASFGTMSLETLETVIQKACHEATHQLNITFQGGEPTLAGRPFFEAAVAFLAQYAPADLEVNLALQTNGLTLDDDWCQFLKQHNFLVGLSVDGTRGTHDRYRRTPDDHDTFAPTWTAWHRLTAHDVPTNVLTVVTPYLAERIDAVYRFYQNHRISWQQYIPCLPPFDDGEAQDDPASLTAEQYGDFLCRLFDLWYQDVTHGRPIHIRTFENWVAMAHGHPPESCGLAGVCVAQHVVEADGSVYPCDFYCLDNYRQGKITDDGATFAALDAAAEPFIDASVPHPAECLECPVYALCRTGCRRERVPATDDSVPLGPSRYCAGLKRFFTYAAPRLRALGAQRTAAPTPAPASRQATRRPQHG